jgi:hypothetical protein
MQRMGRRFYSPNGHDERFYGPNGHNDRLSVSDSLTAIVAPHSHHSATHRVGEGDVTVNADEPTPNGYRLWVQVRVQRAVRAVGDGGAGSGGLRAVGLAGREELTY